MFATTTEKDLLVALTEACDKLDEALSRAAKAERERDKWKERAAALEQRLADEADG